MPEVQFPSTYFHCLLLPIIMLMTLKLRRVSCFLIQPFFTPSNPSPLARSIPAHKFTNFAMSTYTLILTCNTTLFWWPRKLKDVPFGVYASCSDMGLWRHSTPTFKTMALRSSTPTKACNFGWAQPMPLVNSRTTYQCAPKYARKGHSRSPTGSSC